MACFATYWKIYATIIDDCDDHQNRSQTRLMSYLPLILNSSGVLLVDPTLSTEEVLESRRELFGDLM